MGKMFGWRYGDCGAGESFHCGGGMLFFNEPEVVELSKKGDFGEAMKQLFRDGIPEGWTVFRENVYYLCPGCEGAIDGGTLRIKDGGPGWLVYHTAPSSCPSCGEELVFWDDKVPMSERDIAARCDGRAEEGCPKCGGRYVESTFGCWD